jgi:plasmid maintenance system antidote protein VapI
MENISKKLLAHTRQAIDKGQSINNLATAAGVQVATVSRWIKGERTITLETADKLAAYFGLEMRATRKGRKRVE